jgi:hypothetical protein
MGRMEMYTIRMSSKIECFGSDFKWYRILVACKPKPSKNEAEIEKTHQLMDLLICRCGDGSFFLVIIVDPLWVCSVGWRRDRRAVVVERKEKRVKMRGGVWVLGC